MLWRLISRVGGRGQGGIIGGPNLRRDGHDRAIAKVLLVLLIGLFSLLVGVDNIIDYGTNYAFVAARHVDGHRFPQLDAEVARHHQPGAAPRGLRRHHRRRIAHRRALPPRRPAAVERARCTSRAEFNAAKAVAVAGLVLGFALWFFGFMAVGGEWFQMWQSQTWNGQEAAFRFIGCIGFVLIFLAQKDDELA